MKTTASLLLVIFLVMPMLAVAQEAGDNPKTDTNNQCIVWSSGDREVALKLVYMYVYNAKKRAGWIV